MVFSVFDDEKIQEYKKQAKMQWGESKEYKEYEQKSKKIEMLLMKKR